MHLTDTTDTPKPDPTCTPRLCFMQPLTIVISDNRECTTPVKLPKSTKLILQKFNETSDGKSFVPFDYIFPLGNTASYKQPYSRKQPKYGK